MNVNAIEIHGLEKSFKRFKLGPLQLTVPKGSIYGLIGPNAAGKTTTFDLIMGLGKKDGGEVRIFGLDHVENEVEVKRRIGYVSPDLNYVAWRRVKRLIHFVRQFYPSWDDDYCRALLGRFGIGWNDSLRTMSFGTKIKLALVAALSHRPDLLLLDEPTIGVDAVSKQQIFSELLAAVQDEERTVVIASHSLSDIERFTDRVGMIKHGRIILEGATSDVIERFCMVDFVYTDRLDPAEIKGLYVKERQGDRWRALLSKQNGAHDKLKYLGAKEISESPVTLEELFVTLTLAKEA